MRQREKGLLMLIVFFAVPFFILRIYTVTHDFVEKKYETWQQADAVGVFRNELLPPTVPNTAYDILLSHDEEMRVFWGAFSIPDRNEIEELLSDYQVINRLEFKELSFPHPGGFPWGGDAPTLADLESYDGRKEKIEYYIGYCKKKQGQAIVVFNGYENKVYYGCAL
jgi:hypothetical protein